jgi:hypothetical protein
MILWLVPLLLPCLPAPVMGEGGVYVMAGGEWVADRWSAPWVRRASIPF